MRLIALSAFGLALHVAPTSALEPQPATPAPELDQSEARGPTETDETPRHRGFLARATLGPGYFYAANKSFSASGDRRVLQGGTASLALAFGGVTNTGFLVLGGSYVRDAVFALSAKDSIVDGDEPDFTGYGMTLHSLGFFADVYFGPESGTHVQALVARGTLRVDNPSGSDRNNPDGLVVGLGIGHEFWLANHFLVGPLLAVSHGLLKVDETGSMVTMRTLIPTLSVTGTVN
jgi:hypothetical protein